MSLMSSVTESPLDKRSLYTYLAARFSATQAFHVFLVSVGWHLYELTGSALDLGLLGLFQFIPTMAMLLVVGHVVDHYNRIRVLRVVQLISMCSVGALAFVSHQGAISRELIFAFVFLYSITRAFEGPAQQAILPSLVSPRQLPRAIAAAHRALGRDG